MTDKPMQEYRTLLSEISKVLSARTDQATSDRISLRDAVCAYFRAELARGATLKGVIQTVREILKRAESVADDKGVATDSEYGELTQQLVDWCVEFHRKPAIASIQ